ncbi:MAG: hypothetical protein FWG17_03330, partial [Desulfovibrionaceae bacterium]|nr:hypothetical protein [Desulfovibrionaceae bacterium]
MSEYVYCWRVQVAYGLKDIPRQKLVASLASISGAVKEYFSWCLVNTPPVMTVSPSADIGLRATVLHSSLLELAGEHVYQAQGILRDVILSVYEEERPEMNSLPEDFSQNADFPLERFRSLYLDSLLLRREDVRTYCRKNQIRQVREVKGLLWEDAPSPKADYSTPRESAAAPQPPQPQPKARKKHGAISAGN